MERAAIDATVYEAVRSPFPTPHCFLHLQLTASNLIGIAGYRKGEEPDFSEALIVRSNSTIEDVCDQIHRSLKETFKYALVWGASARHIPQRVGLSHTVSDEDVVSIVVK